MSERLPKTVKLLPEELDRIETAAQIERQAPAVFIRRAALALATATIERTERRALGAAVAIHPNEEDTGQ